MSTSVCAEAEVQRGSRERSLGHYVQARKAGGVRTGGVVPAGYTYSASAENAPFFALGGGSGASAAAPPAEDAMAAQRRSGRGSARRSSRRAGARAGASMRRGEERQVVLSS